MKVRNTLLITFLMILVYGGVEAQTTFGPQQVISITA